MIYRQVYSSQSQADKTESVTRVLYLNSLSISLSSQFFHYLSNNKKRKGQQQDRNEPE
jgi:hypothetical protein